MSMGGGHEKIKFGQMSKSGSSSEEDAPPPWNQRGAIGVVRSVAGQPGIRRNPSLAYFLRGVTGRPSQRGTKMANENQKRTGFSRRDFIKGAAIAASGAVLGGAAAAAATAASVTMLGNAAGPVGKEPSACDGSQDLALVNGKFLTMDDKNSIVSAVAIRNGRIAEVGHAQAIGPCA